MLAVFLPAPKSTSLAPETGRPALRDAAMLFTQRSSFVILAGIVIYGGAYGAYLTVLPITVSALGGLGPTETGLLFAVFYGAVSVSQLATGPLTDRYGRAGFMIGGLMVAALGLAALLLTSAIFLPLAVSSLGLGVFSVASLAMLNDSAPLHLKGTVSGAYFLAWGIGYVSGPLLIGAVDRLAAGVGYGILCLMLAGEALALLALLGVRGRKA